MTPIPDFHNAKFILSAENPFRLTPPSEQALYFLNDNNRCVVREPLSTQSTDTNTSTSPGSNSSGDTDKGPVYPDPSYDAVVTALKNAAKQRTKQGSAYLSLVNSELMLIKKSLFVSVFAALTGFVLSIVSLLILNIGIGLALYSLGVSTLGISFILLGANIGLSILCYRIAKKAFYLVSFERLIRLLKRSLSN